jgi:hypothetical protein
VIAALRHPGMAEVLQVERLVPEAQSAEEPNERPGTGQLGIPAVRSAAGMPLISREGLFASAELASSCA